MSTVQQVVSRALRTIRVLDPGKTPTGADMDTGIEVLNAMMIRWEADGACTGWVAVSTSTETMPIPPETEEAVVYNLAARLGTEYGQPLSRELAFAAQSGYTALLRDRMMEMPLNQKTGIPTPEGNGTIGYNDFMAGNWY